MAKYSLQEIKKSYAQKKRFDNQFPLSSRIVRPLSFYSAWALLRITKSPSRIAGASLVIGLAGCLCFFKIPEWSVWPGLILLLIYDLLDATDGNVARVTGSVSYYGRFLDGVIGDLVEGIYPLWLGIGLYRIYHGAPSTRVEGYAMAMLLAGVAMTWGKMYSGAVMRAYYAQHEQIQRLTKTGQAESTVTEEVGMSTYSKSWWYLLHLNVSSFDIQLFVLLTCAAVRRLDLFLLGYAPYFVLQAVAYFAFYLRRAQRALP